MPRKSTIFPQIDRHWLITWSTIYISFNLINLFYPHFWGVTLIQYVGIFLCLIYAYQSFRTDSLLIIAFLFTLLADTILMWIHAETIGVYVFCFAQFFHTARLGNTRPKFLMGYFITIFVIFCFGLTQGYNPVYTISFIYALAIVTNLVIARRLFRSDPTNIRFRLAFIGFILFLCCDTCVAVSYLANVDVLPKVIFPFVNYFVWVFYYPSQVLLSNSSIVKK